MEFTFGIAPLPVEPFICNHDKNSYRGYVWWKVNPKPEFGIQDARINAVQY